MNNKEVFTNIYKTWAWGKDEESRSGPGSSLQQAKESIRQLPIIFEQYGIKTVLDLSCGDFNWMRHVDLSNVTYLGTDIVDELIASNNEKYAKENVSFKVLDLINDPIPKHDLLILRDTLFHFTNEDVIKALTNIKNSESTYLFTTSYIHSSKNSIFGHETNSDINTGAWRPLNLEMPPFNLPEPLHRVFDLLNDFYHKDRSVSLWKISDL